MEIWHLWTSLLAQGLAFLGAHFGLSEALTVVVLTLAVRLALMPLSLTAAFRAEHKKQKMLRIKPELEALKERHQGDAAQLAAGTMALYREHGVTLLDRITLASMVSQSVFGLGLYRVLRDAGFSAKFLWIASLARPDVWLTALVGVLMLLGMALMPGAVGAGAEPSMLIMLSVSVVVAVVTIAALPSAIGLYWATSNAVTVLQTLVLRGLLQRQRSA
ncbi:MAG TPA: membrane protein insertase YidC [Burkholderiaceae bacterium]|jgi:YidC/Oxa1 family membrane protein insertase